MTIDRDAAAALFGHTVPRDELSPRRPSIAMIACLLVVAWGLLESLAAALGVLASLIQTATPNMSGLGVAGWMFEHFRILAISQLSLGVITLGCGAAAWAGRKWARRASQALMVLWAFLFCALGVAMAVSVTGFSGAGPLGTSFFWFWRATALLAGITWGAFAALPAWLLGREDVRRWFEEHAG